MTDIIYASKYNVAVFREAIEDVNKRHEFINIKILSERKSEISESIRFELEFNEPSDLYYLGIAENLRK